MFFYFLNSVAVWEFLILLELLEILIKILLEILIKILTSLETEAKFLSVKIEGKLLYKIRIV